MIFTHELVERILRSSEGAVALLQTRHGARTVVGHTGERHSAIDRVLLEDRGPGATAFVDFRQAVEIGTLVLAALMNDPVKRRDYDAMMAQSSGMKKIAPAVDIGQKRDIRMSNAAKMVHCSTFRIVLLKNRHMPANLMVETFYPMWSGGLSLRPEGAPTETDLRRGRSGPR